MSRNLCQSSCCDSGEHYHSRMTQTLEDEKECFGTERY